MSNKLLTAVWDNAPFSGGNLLVYLALADQASDEGVCWPSMATIAKKARMNVRNAREHVRTLREEGFIEQYERKGMSAWYVVLSPEPGATRPEPPDDGATPVASDLPPDDDTTPVASDLPPRSPATYPPVASDLPPRSPATARTIIEPLSNPKRSEGTPSIHEIKSKDPEPEPEPAPPMVEMSTPHWPTLFAWGRSVDGQRALARQGLLPPYRNTDLLRVYREVQERSAQAWNNAIVRRAEEPPQPAETHEKAHRQPA